MCNFFLTNSLTSYLTRQRPLALVLFLYQLHGCYIPDAEQTRSICWSCAAFQVPKILSDCMQVTQGLARYGATITTMALEVLDSSAWDKYAHGAVSLFSMMPKLQCLQLACPGTFLDASSDLGQLEMLPHLRVLIMRELTCHSPWQATSLSSLGTLKKLEHLSIKISHPGPTTDFLPATLTCLTRLSHLDLVCWGDCIDNMDLGRVLGQIPSLEEVWLGCLYACIPSGLSGLPNLKTAYLGDLDNRNPDGPIDAPFEDGALQACPSLTWLVLYCFDAETATSAQSFSRSLSALTALQSLTLQTVDLSCWSTFGCTFPSCIGNLFLMECSLTSLPSCLVHHTGLISLDLQHNPIADLPSGPYLKHLRALDITCTQVEHAPAALAEAHSLENLVADGVWCEPFDTPHKQPHLRPSCIVSDTKRTSCWPGEEGYPVSTYQWFRSS